MALTRGGGNGSTGGVSTHSAPTAAAIPSSHLAGATTRGEITALYQPQLDVATGAVVGAEALSRWTSPEHGEVPADVFIGVAERDGMIDEIGDFMLDEAARTAARLREVGRPLQVSINVSTLQLVESDFVDRLVETTRSLQLPAGSLTVEVTETVPVQDFPTAVALLTRVREAGIDVSLDDIGSGQASIDQLILLPVTEIKLDQSLVRGEDPDDEHLLRRILQLAADRGLRTVAEGVETSEQLARIGELGCDRVQGYLVGRPMTASALEQLVLDA